MRETGSRDGVEYGVDIPDGSRPAASDPLPHGRGAWVSPDGIAVVADLSPVVPDEAPVLEAFLGTMIHTYRERDGATVRNTTRLAVDGADSAIGYALVTDRDGATEHRMIVGAVPTGVPHIIANLQISWQTIGTEIPPAQQRAVGAIIDSWHLRRTAG